MVFQFMSGCLMSLGFAQNRFGIDCLRIDGEVK